jgi:serine protease Do
VVNAKTAGASVEGLGFAIPSNRVRTVTDEIIANGYVTGRPEIGITLLQVSDPQTAFAVRVNELGVYVRTVSRDNGLMVGDRIVSVDGAEIETASGVVAALEGKKVGDVLRFIIKRDGNEISVDVTLAERVPEHIVQRRAAQSPAA